MAKRWYYKDENGNKVPVPQYKINSDNHYTKSDADNKFATKEMINAADEEDITSENNLLKLKDRSALNGMGYIILRKNKSFAEQVTKENTIYEIRYDFELGGAEVTIPENCVLKFEGGSIKDGTIKGDTISISSTSDNIFTNIEINGIFVTPFNIRWINAANDSERFQIAADSNINEIFVPIGEYEITETIEVSKSKSFILEGISSNQIRVSISNYSTGAIQKTVHNDCAVLKIMNNVDVFHVTRGHFIFKGGAIECFHTDYTSNVFCFTKCKVEPVDIETNIDNKPKVSPSYSGGTAIYVDIRNNGTDVDGNGNLEQYYAAAIHTKCNINFFEYGVYLQSRNSANKEVNIGTNNNPVWKTDSCWMYEFEENSQMWCCKTCLYVDGAEVGKITGKYQAGAVSTEQKNDIPLVYFNGKNTYIDCVPWDCDMKLGNRYTNQYSIEFGNEAAYELGERTERGRYYFKNYGKNIKRNYYLEPFNRFHYTMEYNDLDNWFLLRKGFTATYEYTNCSAYNDPNNIFRQYDNYFRVKIPLETKDSAKFKVTINVNKDEGLIYPLIMGTLCYWSSYKVRGNERIYTGNAFTKVKLHMTFNDGTEIDKEYEAPNATLQYLYFTDTFMEQKVDTAYVTQIIIEYSNYVGNLGEADIYSIFGTVRGKALNYHTSAGGTLFGNIQGLNGNRFYGKSFETLNTTEQNNMDIGAVNHDLQSDKLVYKTKNNEIGYINAPIRFKTQSSVNPYNYMPILEDGNNYDAFLESLSKIPDNTIAWDTQRLQVLVKNNTRLYNPNGSPYVFVENGKLQYFNNIGTENPNLGQVQFDTDYVKLGYMYLMSDLKKPCWAFGRYQYCEADGVKARTPRNGTFANKPTVSNNFIYTGFAYFCIDRQTSEGSTNGIMIYHKGNDIWVDALGRIIE